MAKKKPSQNKIISNRRARHDYVLGDFLLAGLSLTGREVKALRIGHGQLRGAYVNVRNDELWLINASISGTNGIPISEAEQVRDRKLLIKRRELKALVEAKQRGQTIVPLEILASGRYIKLKIALGKGKKLYDKRQSLKLRDDQRRTANEIKKYRDT